MHFQVSVTCQSKQMFCSLSHAPTVLWLYSCFCPYSKWDIPMRRPQIAAWSLWKCVSRDKFQDVRRAVSGKGYTGHCHFGSILSATPPLCTPKMSNTFPQLKYYLVSLHYFTLWGRFVDITQRNCISWPIPRPFRHGTNVPMLRMRCLN